MTPLDVFKQVAEAVFGNLSPNLKRSLEPTLRNFPEVWEYCQDISEAVQSNDRQAVGDALLQLDLLLNQTGGEYFFSDLQYILEQRMAFLHRS